MKKALFLLTFLLMLFVGHATAQQQIRTESTSIEEIDGKFYLVQTSTTINPFDSSIMVFQTKVPTQKEAVLASIESKKMEQQNNLQQMRLQLERSEKEQSIKELEYEQLKMEATKMLDKEPTDPKPKTDEPPLVSKNQNPPENERSNKKTQNKKRGKKPPNQ
jgi:hypothetical protein